MSFGERKSHSRMFNTGDSGSLGVISQILEQRLPRFTWKISMANCIAAF